MPVAPSFQASDRHGSFGKHAPAVAPYGIARLLMGGALERIEAAREHPATRQSQLRSAVMIIGELRADLDLSGGGDLAANLADLYDYMCRRLGACSDRLLAADLTNGIAALDEVSHLLDALHSAWTFMPAEVRAASRN